MTPEAQLSRDQRAVLAGLLQSQLLGLERESESRLDDQSQVDSARRTLMQDADDARQRAGEHEVEGIVADIDSDEFKAISDALERVHGADYGVCVDCDERIPFDRLRLEPQTLRCVACQTLHERDRGLT